MLELALLADDSDTPGDTSQIFVLVSHEFKMVHSAAFSARRVPDLCDERSSECFVLGDDRGREGGKEE